MNTCWPSSKARSGRRRPVARHLIAEIHLCQIDAGGDGLHRLCLGILAPQGDKLVLGILPGDRGHIGLLGGAQLHVIGAQVGIDEEVCGEVRSRGLHQNVDLLRSAGPTLGITDDPAHRVAGSHRPRAHQLLAGLQAMSVTCPGAA